MAQFSLSFPSLPAPRTNRTHCIAFSDYDSQPQVAAAHGIRLDTNYYYWPGPWVQNRPGFMTGSGMPMRFTRLDGTIVDVYQAATQMTDESDQSFPGTMDALLDNALGPNGYYGAFVANMHTDVGTSAGSDAIVASALARSVPVISGEQLLTWVDGRNASAFGNFAFTGSTLTFSIAVGSGANGLEAMLPHTSGALSLVSLTREGTPVPYRVETIKGIAYAIFTALNGTYQAEFVVDATAPTITGVGATAGSTSATVSWSTNEAATSRVDFGVAPDALSQSASSAGLATGHSVPLTSLANGTTYYYQVTSADAAGNTATAPTAPATFTTTTPPRSVARARSGRTRPRRRWHPRATLRPSNSASSSARRWTDSSPGCASTRGRRTPASTSGICGRRAAPCWRRRRSPARRRRDGSRSRSMSPSLSRQTRSTWRPTTRQTGAMPTTSAAFAAGGVVNGPLEAMASPAAGGNGVYRYGPAAFPNQTYNTTNYWVDVVFATSVVADTTAPTVVRTAPAAGSDRPPWPRR